MALVVADRVKETSTTTGTGTFTLAGAVTGFQSFSVIGNGNTTYYTISSQSGSEWEVGVGTYTSSGTTLARTTVLASSNSGALVNFSAGTKDVFVVYPAGKSVSTDYVQTISNKTLKDPAIEGCISEDIYTITDGAAFEIDPGNGSIQLITLGASRTPKATNFAAGEAVTLMVDDGSAYTITWTDTTFGSAGVIWETNGGVAPVLASSGYTTIVLWKVGSQIYGARVGNA